MSKPEPLPSLASDAELLATARAIVTARYRPRWHEIGAALRTASGNVFAAVHLEANIGRVAVCAEAIALGMAVAAGDGTIETIVAVDADGEVVAPCGMCREMISDYAPAARILLSLDSKVAAISIVSLLPLRSTSDYST